MAATPAWIVWAWGWIGTNYQPLAVVLAALGVLVTWRYVVLTRRLAEAANTSATAAKIQADAALRQAEASRVGAQAAADQASVARQVFEAAHRPYLSASIAPQSFLNRAGKYHFLFVVKNYGPIPALIVGWRAVVWLSGKLVAERLAEAGDRGLCVFPQRDLDLDIQNAKGGVIDDPQEPVEVEFAVEYQGYPGGPTHMSRIRGSGKYQWWDWVYEEVR